VVAVGVAGADPAELVPGQLGGLGVVRGDLLAGGAGGQRPELEQRLWAWRGSTGCRWR